MHKALIVLLFVTVPGVSLAQTEPVSDARFQIERSGEGYIRLDRQTGAMSTCTVSGAHLDCRAGADERAALQAEIDRLAEEVERLKAASPETTAGASMSKDGKELTVRLPTEAEIKQVVAYFEDMIRRMVEAVKDLANDKA